MFKHILIIILCFAPFLSKSQIVYKDASQFPLYGKATSSTKRLYARLPDSLNGKIRQSLWNLGQNSAGLFIRFRSNSTSISAKWTCWAKNTLNHMTPTGTRGLDLYTWEDGKWLFVNSGRPGWDQKNEAKLIQNMKPVEREYMLYLSLYDGVDDLYIGVDSSSFIAQPSLQYPLREKPIVMYGTSILQGGCANRPGMAHTNIISRQLNREVINLGFSGNGQLDYEVAQVMTQVDAGVFVLDFVPNASVEQINNQMKNFYHIIRDKHPNTPIIFIEDPIFTHSHFDTEMLKEITSKNQALHKIYSELKSEGEKHIYLVSSKNMIGDDMEATVDGIHFTDLGMMRYANLLCPIIKRLLK